MDHHRRRLANIKTALVQPSVIIIIKDLGMSQLHNSKLFIKIVSIEILQFNKFYVIIIKC